MAILEMRDVSYSYHSKYQHIEAVKHVTCQFEQGKAYAIAGKSGSGKSTLLSLLGGLDLPAAGEVLFEGKPTRRMDLAKYRRECAPMIYQSFRLFPLLTVSENITYPMELDRFPNMLSGGEQQRVAIARALSMDSKLLLADEPTGNLDEENSLNIVDILIKLAHENDYCVVIASHDLSILPKVDFIYHMNSGVLYQE